MPIEQKVSDLGSLQKRQEEIYDKFRNREVSKGFSLAPLGKSGLSRMEYNESQDNKALRYALMNETLAHKIDAGYFGKASVSTGSNLYGYDLRRPSIHLLPWLSPIRDKTPRVQHEQPGTAANWKSITVGSYNAGGFLADPWINEGSRAPLISISAVTNTAPYASIGIDGSDTYEAQSAGRDFEDPLSTARFIGLEQLMVKEEDALLGGNRTLKLGTANTPTGTSGTDFYIAVVGLSYSGYRNQSATAGLIQQKSIVTPDGKTMVVNGGMGQISATSANLAKTAVVNVVPKIGELAYAWYAGTTTTNMTLQLITTVPTLAANALATVTTTGQLYSTLTTGDFSVNDGTTGGQANQVTAFDGFLTQAFTAFYNGGSTANAYQINLKGATLTASGRGSVKEIDTALKYAWDNFRISYEEIHVNSQEMLDITTACLSNASGPLVRYEMSGDGEHYDLTASGTVAFYFNPFLPGGGRKIPIIVHPFLPAGTIFMKANSLPPYFKKSNMTSVAEVICRRDYYSIDWAPVTREYNFGTYSEEVLAVYAPFCLGIITGIGAGSGT